ncbi:MAG: NAD(P)H-dependent oxidoreductase [Phycisphaerae bacterium]
MRYFIVHAHHEPRSFNGAQTQKAVAALRAARHEVEVSDLYAMRFDPVSDRRNFTTVGDAAYLKQQQEEMHASKNDGFAPEVLSEIQKVERCDVLVFQFPLWWFGMPAILKGWCDRVLVMGRVYGGGRWYESGIGAGKRALLSMTTGGPEPMYSWRGLNPAMRDILKPIQHGIFWFNGFQPIAPFITWGPVRMTPEARVARLDEWATHLLRADELPVIPHLPTSAFDSKSGFVDRWPRFMVTWQLRHVSDLDAALRQAEHGAMEQLRQQGLVLDGWISVDNRRGGFVLRSPTHAEAKQIMERLPLWPHLVATIDEMAEG